VTNHRTELLRRVYETVDRGNVPPVEAPLARAIRKLMEIYAEGARVEVIDILVNGRYGVVLTREEMSRSGERMTWRGVHLWTFHNGRPVQFEAYRQALIVTDFRYDHN
jgi:ketosteroid isomerase-like protein